MSAIAIPPLGTNNGGLDWAKVKQMIIDAFAHIALQKLNLVKGIERFLVLSQFGITTANVVDDV